jgi:hypothetical protein
MNIQDLWSGALHLVGKAWWVEITTERPHCTYYFGPFATAVEADEAKAGYIEDLESERAEGIQVAIKRCKPVHMTIDYESSQDNYSRSTAPMSGQFG